MKKALKITGIILVILIAILIAIPFIFEGKIKELVKETINENLNAKVEFSDVNLSFISSFPEAQIEVIDLAITNYEPFKDETFITAQSIAFTMSVKEFFKDDDEPLVINSIHINETLITLKTDKFGNNNYDITIESDDDASASTEIETESGGFAFSIKDYSIKNSAFTYIDESSNIVAHLSEFNHEGSGTFSAEVSELNTKTSTSVSVSMDSVNYLKSNPIKLDAVIVLDLNNNKYTFKENKALINQLPIHFNGWVQLLDNGQDIDITFENPESDFKNFLALIPETYSKSIEDVKTTGDFKVKGIVKGQLTETTIPTFNISIISNNASFKYPDLPKGIDKITINTVIKNTSGNIDDTSVDINALNFQIDQDVFKSSASLKNITQNMSVQAKIDGTLNLANITKTYPIDLDQALSGILKANINTAFDMEAIDTNAYERIKSSGTASLTNFVYTSEDFKNPMEISQASLSFNPDTVTLNNFSAKTGETDLNASGSINNLLGFLLSNTTLKGNFNLNATLFKLNDFMSETAEVSENTKPTETTGTTSTTEALKIPAFLDCTIKANAKMVMYDNLNLENVSGTLIIKDETVTLENLSSNIFSGKLAFSGDVSTKTETPTFNMNLDASNFDIAQSFKALDLLQKIAPIANLFEGKLNTKINLSGNLDQEFLPKLNSLSGNAFAELLTTQFKQNQSALINKLDGALSFIKFEDINLKDLKANLKFTDGKVNVTPFSLKYKDIDITVSGAHGFDQAVDYNAVFNVPAKYLGSDINRLIGKIDDPKVNNISIPVTANITGDATNPSVKTDLSSGVKNLSNQLIQIEKEKLLNKGKSEVNSLINNVISGNNSKSDSLKQQQNNSAQKAINNIIKPKTATDSASNSTSSSEKIIKNALGGLLGGKKKTDNSEK